MLQIIEENVPVSIADELNRAADLAAMIAKAAEGLQRVGQNKKERRPLEGIEAMAWGLSDQLIAISNMVLSDKRRA